MKKIINIQLISILYTIIGFIYFQLIYKTDTSEILLFGIAFGLFLLYFWLTAKFFNKKYVLAIVIVPISYIFYSILIILLRGIISPLPEDDIGAGILMLIIHFLNLFSLITGSVAAFIFKFFKKT